MKIFMKKTVILLLALVVLVLPLFLRQPENVQAQIPTSFTFDFTGAPVSSSCSPWLSSSPYVSGFAGGGFEFVDAMPTPNMNPPHCVLGSGTFISLNTFSGFLPTSLSFVTDPFTTGTVTLYDTTIPATVFSGPITAFFSYSGTAFDSVNISFSGASNFIDNITLSMAAAVQPDPRMNEIWAPVAIYCTAGGGIDVYEIVGDDGVFLARATPAQILYGIESAETYGRNIRIVNTGSADVWALTSGEIQINDGEYVHRFYYEERCGELVVAEEDVIPVIVEEGPEIINRPGD
jgi:hypothetical protein